MLNQILCKVSFIIAISLTALLTSELSNRECFAVQKRATTSPQTFRRLSSQEYQKQFTKWYAQGYVAEAISVQVIGNKPTFNVTFVKPTNKVVSSAIHDASTERYKQRTADALQRGLVESEHQTYRVNGKTLHIAVWRSLETKTLGRIWASPRAVPALGKTDTTSAPLDELFKSFLHEHQIPGATVAVSYRGKILYCRGFGYSNLEQKNKMRPNTQMRIASVSKPITGAAITQLVDRGRLRLDDTVFDVLEFTPTYPKSVRPKPVNGNFKTITIQQLLHHTGGFDRKASYDPMFRSTTVAQAFRKPLPASSTDIIGYMMSQPLDFKPGSKMAYSNFGYCLLGRVIEKVSGTTYEKYVQDNILKPVGANETLLGRTKEDLRFQNEAKYYLREQSYARSVVGDTKSVKSQYGAWNLEAMDAHGGWVSTASDLAKFASEFDNLKTCRLMSAPAVQSMFTAPTYFKRANAERYYGFGWSVVNRQSRLNAYHMGSLPGTSSLLVRRYDGFNWAVLFNCRKTLSGKEPAREIDSLMHRAVTQSAKNAGLK